LGIAGPWTGRKARVSENPDQAGELRTLERHSGFGHRRGGDAGRGRAVSVFADRMLKAWNLESGRELRTLEGHHSEVYGLAVKPIAQTIAGQLILLAGLPELRWPRPSVRRRPVVRKEMRG
jgi:hypothetical protein